MSPPAGGPATLINDRPWRRAAVAVLALLFLNGMLSFRDWWPTPGILPDHRLAPEFVLLWLALLAAVAWRGNLSPRALSLFALVDLLLVLGRYADVTVHSLFGRPINLYWDGVQIPRFLWVSAQELAWWQSTAVLAAVGVLFGILFCSLRWAIACRHATPSPLPCGLPGPGRSRWRACCWCRRIWQACARPGRSSPNRSCRPTGGRHNCWRPPFRRSGRPACCLPRPPIDTALAAAPGTALAALGGRDVYLIMLESLGAVVYDDARADGALRASRERFAADIAASGRQVVSAFFRSPTFAGGSDLTHLGLLSGMDLSDPMRHDVLLTTQRPTLNALFRAHGYQTFGLYPALDWEWPERAFYGFDVFLARRDLGYAGPSMGFWQVPDQFSAARFEQLHPRWNGAPPRFVFFPTITCHLPFSPVPPYQPDWSRVLGPQPFDAAAVRRAQAEQPNWLNMFPDFLRMVAYTYQWLGAYLRQPSPREAIYLLIGDHQPAANITGEVASWDVPVHIVSSDGELLARFIAQGFQPGLEPPRQALGPLHLLTGMMLQAFSAPGYRPPSSLPLAQARP
jgi:hypothetical protein